jgi:G:T-mismatch repair DNA endonuclease (very short patch repair protein)
MKETHIEKKLKKRIEGLGGKCKKFVSPGSSGEPDRICLFPGGRVFFVEIKAPGKKARPLQEKRHEELRELGFKVLVVDTEEEVNEISAP